MCVILAYNWSIRDTTDRGSNEDSPPARDLLVGNYMIDSYAWLERFEAGRTRNYIYITIMSY